jgi:hypothetical protein
MLQKPCGMSLTCKLARNFGDAAGDGDREWGDMQEVCVGQMAAQEPA